ncbi:hypothetical protein Lser_V15G02378 [Lactuca serriola]
MEKHVLESGSIDTVGTVGILELHPGAINSIPSKAQMEIGVVGLSDDVGAGFIAGNSSQTTLPASSELTSTFELPPPSSDESGGFAGSDQGKVGPCELQGVGKNVVSVSSSRPGSSSHVSFSISRPSSNYNNRIQQAIGLQKVGPSIEWKLKTIAQSQRSIKVPVAVVPVEAHTPTTVSSASSTNLDSKEDELEKKLKESHISDDKHVIIPNHLHVPEAEKLGFCFGSFDATNENVDGEEDHLERPTTSSSNVPENLPTEGDMSSNAGPEYREPNFGFMTPMIGSQVTSFENTESQARDASHVPSFIVQQPFDPASYYAHFYHESDGRMSPFHSTTKYNGNAQQPSHSSQESGGSYGPCASAAPVGYNSTSAAANSTSNEDLGGSHSHSQFKETNVYTTGQQSEGPGVWIAGPGPGRDMSGSFYNLPQGGQVAYTTPTQQPNDAHLLLVDLPELKYLTNRLGVAVSIQTRLRAMVARDEFRRRRNKAATIVQGEFVHIS